jgi:hypothetical protein
LGRLEMKLIGAGKRDKTPREKEGEEKKEGQ